MRESKVHTSYMCCVMVCPHSSTFRQHMVVNSSYTVRTNVVHVLFMVCPSTSAFRPRFVHVSSSFRPRSSTFRPRSSTFRPRFIYVRPHCVRVSSTLLDCVYTARSQFDHSVSTLLFYSLGQLASRCARCTHKTREPETLISPKTLNPERAGI
jgi:hypothetical protein